MDTAAPALTEEQSLSVSDPLHALQLKPVYRGLSTKRTADSINSKITESVSRFSVFHSLPSCQAVIRPTGRILGASIIRLNHDLAARTACARGRRLRDSEAVFLRGCGGLLHSGEYKHAGAGARGEFQQID